MSHSEHDGLVILFFARHTDQAGEDYSEMDRELSELVKDAPGFQGVKSFKAEDGEHLSVVWWRDEETLRQWRDQARHAVAQETGRERWYQYYRMEVAHIRRRTAFQREPSPVATASTE